MTETERLTWARTVYGEARGGGAMGKGSLSGFVVREAVLGVEEQGQIQECAVSTCRADGRQCSCEHLVLLSLVNYANIPHRIQ